MTLVLDSGGLSALARQRARLAALLELGMWPAQVPAPVLTESLTGDARRDFHTNRLLRSCQVRVVDELVARRAAALRTETGRASTISATDAIVAAHALGLAAPVILTSDPRDLRALVERESVGVVVQQV